MTAAAAALSGFLFGWGLCLSQMIQPPRVLGFLDVAGAWDPTLLFVMAGALAVAIPGFQLALRGLKPVWSAEFEVRHARLQPDRRTVIGAMIFGIGWGLAGLCPGPALAVVVSGQPEALQFLLAMVAGMIVHDRVAAPRS